MVMVDTSEANGALPQQGAGGPPPVEDAPPLEKRMEWVEVQKYPGWKMYIWVNFPARLFQDVKSGDEAKVKAALKKIILATNNWKDDEGVPFPQPVDPTFYEQIPTELAALMLVTIQQEATRLPNSVLATGRS